MVNVIAKEQIVVVDVDQTLVMWDDKNYDLEVRDPSNGVMVKLRRHNKHAWFIRHLHERGHTIIVWSAAGHKWAHAVVDALCLDKHVSYVMTKPIKYVDDLKKAEDILGQRVYLKDNK